MRCVLAGLLLFASAAFGQDAVAVLRKAKAVRDELRPQVNQFLSNEEIRYFETKPGKARKAKGSITYEVMSENGSAVYRLVARNGKPIPEHKREKLPVDRGERRVGLDFADILTGRSYTATTRNTSEGPRILIEARLTDRNPPAPDRKGLSKSADILLWVNPANHWVMREEYLLISGDGRFPAGTKIEFIYQESHGLPLRSSATIVRTLRSGVRLETEQTYSGYRKFAVDSTVTFGEP